jgi:hypothetical protein
MKVAEVRASCARIRSATKTRTLFFYPSIVRCSQEEENRQSEKLHSTLKVWRKELSGRSLLF